MMFVRESSRTRSGAGSLALVLTLCSVQAQSLPGPAVPTGTGSVAPDSPEQKRVQFRLRDAVDAVGRGDHARAMQHFDAALTIAPTGPAVLRALAEASTAKTPELALASLHRLWLASMDAKGKCRLERSVLRGIDKAIVARVEALARARAAAVAELASYAKGLPSSGKRGLGKGVLARWASDLAIELTRAAPSLRASFASRLDAAVARHRPDYASVLSALSKVMQRKQRASESAPDEDQLDDLAMRAARCLTGMGAQAAFKKLEGPRPPDVSRIVKLAKSARAKLRGEVLTRTGELYDLAKLRALSAKEREAFTKRHAHWSRPAIGVSPTGLYRVETTCGYATLLGALQTVELHHKRLAAWFGKDPFKSRQGIVRIVPDSSGLESEGSPFWWAGGFQAGDVTVVKFAWSSIAGLGRTLTHELTHRFDGLLRPSLPAWLSEGRAVWTGSAYGNAEDSSFVDRYLSPWSMQTAYVRGYGGGALLRRLLEGKIDYYRDNYPVGHALFSFLRSWQMLDKAGKPVDGRLVFAKRLEAYMRRIRAGRKRPYEFFVEHFADGKAGRPDGYGAFLKSWNRFLNGCYRRCWNESVPWLQSSRYTMQRSAVTRGQRVLDEPTFTWAPTRAEPWFGQTHAAEAGRILRTLGMKREAAAAYLWGLRTDGYVEGDVLALVALLRELEVKDAAWVLALERGRRIAGTAAARPGASAPQLARLRRLRAFVALLAQTHREAADAGQTVLARILAEEHERVALWTGVDGLASSAKVEAPVLHSAHEGPRRLDLLGLVEEGLTSFEEKRVRGCWFVDDDGHVHVGRFRPRKKTGVLDRRIHIRDAYVRGAAWQEPGRYVFRTRVHFTTSHVNGAILLGITRRDRSVRTSFVAGDYLYAIGRSEDVKKTDSVRLGTAGLWDREGGLGLASRSKPVKFAQPVKSFALEILVDGPTAHVSVDGRLVHSYTTPELTPIEGFVGAAMHSGAVRLQDPTIERLDRGAFASRPRAAGLSLREPEPRAMAELLGARTRGIPVSPHGTALVWFPSEEGDKYFERSEKLARREVEALIETRLTGPQQWVFVMPATWDDERKQALRLDASGYGDGRVRVLEHRAPGVLGKGPWVCFIDELGVLRAARRVSPKGGGIGEIRRWLRQYRSRSGQATQR